MSNKIEQLSKHRRKKSPQSIEGAIKRAKQHMRNLNIEDLDEPEGLASGGNMNEFAKDPEAYDKKEREKEKSDERK